MKRFPSYKQLDEKDCGPACLKIILKYYGKYVALDKLHELCETQRHGTTLLSLSMAAESLGFQATGLKIDYESLKDDLVLPCIVFWQQKHFVVVYKVSQNKVFVSDPAYGLITYIKEEFLNNWLTDESGGTGIALMLQPTSDFEKEDEESERRISISYIWNHLKRHKGLISQLFFSLLAGTLIQFAFPLLAQSLVDHGIQDQNLSFVYMVLLAQLMLFLGKLFLEVIRTYIIIHIGTRLQITLLSEFFLKLMRLPVSFFDSKVTGDIVQRISDHKKIEGFITVTSLNGLFSIINLIVFSAILLLYNSLIFFIFLVGSCLFFAWILMFQKKKREYDYKLFSQLCDEQNKVLEII
jgi:ATP-binding cassette subfamily B protein